MHHSSAAMTAELLTHRRKFSLASLSSTCAGETASESVQSSDENTTFDTTIYPAEQAAFFAQDNQSTCFNENSMHMDRNYSNTQEIHNFANAGYRSDAGEDDLCSPFPCSYLDRNDMPSTREPSPEPMWRNAFHDNQWTEAHFVAEQFNAHGQRPPMASRELPAQRRSLNPPAQQPYTMMLLVPKPVFLPATQLAAPNANVMNHGGVPAFPLQTSTSSAAQVSRGTPVVTTEPAATQRKPPPASSMPPAQAPEQKEQKAQTASSKRVGNAKTRGNDKNAGKAKSAGNPKTTGNAKSSSAINSMSDSQKEALCKFIYDVMLQKEFTSPDGYLVVDVFTEVWKDVGDTGGEREGWRVAQYRFADLLRAAPQYFRLFRRSIRVANQCGGFARKGEKMVRLVLEDENVEK
jgi:hypothetical protein